MELKYASLEEFEANAKIVKLEKSFRKKFANVIETVELALQRFVLLPGLLFTFRKWVNEQLRS